MQHVWIEDELENALMVELKVELMHEELINRMMFVFRRDRLK